MIHKDIGDEYRRLRAWQTTLRSVFCLATISTILSLSLFQYLAQRGTHIDY